MTELAATVDWQTVIAVCCVAVAGIYVLGKSYRAIFQPQRNGCGSCSKGNDGVKHTPLVELTLPSSPSHSEPQDHKIK